MAGALDAVARAGTRARAVVGRVGHIAQALANASQARAVAGALHRAIRAGTRQRAVIARVRIVT